MNTMYTIVGILTFIVLFGLLFRTAVNKKD